MGENVTFDNPYWSARTKLDLLAKWLIVHSVVYYKLDESVVSDKAFDDNARQYVALAKEAPQTDSKWRYVMHDFDGSTGFHLFTRLTAADQHDILHIASNLVSQLKLKA